MKRPSRLGLALIPPQVLPVDTRHFQVKKEGDNWGEPELILSQFAGESTLDDEGNLYFVHHYYKNNVMIEADIYVCFRKDI